MNEHMPSAPPPPKKSIWHTLVWALLIAMLVRSFLFQPFNIPSGSMIPTLLIGDHLFVNKFAYGFSRHSLPLSPPIFEGRILERAPKRGDVVVFKLPADDSTDFIKRIIGLPGDTIQMRDGRLYINAQRVPRQRIDDFVQGTTQIAQYIETLSNGVQYRVLDETPRSAGDNTPLYHVPPRHYFMMGDNRDNSADSRVINYVGYVPFENLVGRAARIYFSVDSETGRWWHFWRWGAMIRFERFLDAVR